MSKARAGASAGKNLPPNPLERRPRRVSTGLVVFVVLALAIAVGGGVQYWRGHSAVKVSPSAAAEPAVITGPGTDGQGVTVGQASAKAQIDLYVDFRCPHCKDFEDEAGPTLDQLVDDGTAKVTYHPLAFVNPKASPRLANAFACAAAAGKPRGYADELYAGFEKVWSSDQLLSLGKQLGIQDPGFQQCVNSGSRAGWVDSIGKAAAARGVNGTPTVFVNGTMLPTDELTPEGIKAAVSAA